MDTSQTPQLKSQKIAGFKIWYSDQAIQSTDLEGKTVYKQWQSAPADDVQVVMVYFERLDGQGRHTRLYSSGCDYYGIDRFGRFTSHFDDVKEVSGHILYGKFMNYEALITLEQGAFDDYGDGWLVTVPVVEPPVDGDLIGKP
ncbi:MAG: hypothetical protein KAT71_08090 [Gammaproteobacteria bacterium]|nr:hypothetical protein [Gammaproteobacteria bacterium]